MRTSFCGGPGSRRDELQRKSFGRRARPGSTGTDAEKRLAVPVLLVYALILRPYVLDLVPGNSLVGYLVGEGFDVYLLDWGVPDGQDSDLSFEDYVLDHMAEVVERVLTTSGAGVTHPRCGRRGSLLGGLRLRGGGRNIPGPIGRRGRRKKEWQSEQAEAGELVSVLVSPCAEVEGVALDPLPLPLGRATLPLVSVHRGTFLGYLVEEDRGMAEELVPS